MKITITIFLLFIGMLLNAQDFSDVRICLNPGHGGHDSDDRYIPLTGFWESEGNLTKGLYLRDIFEGWGAFVVMSRTTNTTEDDLPLSQISQIANDNNVDFFHSIHSNAADQRTNVALMLYRGYNNNPVFDEAKAMSSIMWNDLIEDHRQVWNEDYENIFGDWSYYDWGTSGLGVLRHLTMPGVLSEGSHHDYPIECWRLQNMEHRKHESWIFTRSFIEYFGKESFSLGEIVGIVRDSTKSSIHYAVPGSGDEYLPLNNIKVTLLPDNIVYTGDEMNNGFFMFDSIAQGNYTLIYEVDRYITDTLEITAVAGQSVFADRFMQYDTTRIPEAIAHQLDVENDSVNAASPIEITFSEEMDLNSLIEAFVIVPDAQGDFSLSEDLKTLIFQTVIPLEKSTEYTITITPDAKQRWGVGLKDAYEFTFLTKSRNRMILEDSYPKADQTDVTTKLQVRLHFDAELNQPSLIDNVYLADSEGNLLPLANKKITKLNGKGFYTFEPENELSDNTSYKLFVSGDVKDIDNNPIVDDININFTTKAPEPLQNVLLDGFEDIKLWTDPDNSEKTSNTDETKTRILPYKRPVIAGTFSGRLDYKFTETPGVCALETNTPFNLSETESTKAGAWIYGDLSYNKLYFWFENEQQEEASVEIADIDWAGWKFFTVEISELQITGNIFFRGIILETTETSATTGTIYIDEIAADGVNTGISENNRSDNFIKMIPNPMSSESEMIFNLPYPALVNLKLFDINGKEVISIINKQVHAGNSSVAISKNKYKLSPGSIYFYHCEIKPDGSFRNAVLKTGKLVVY